MSPTVDTHASSLTSGTPDIRSGNADQAVQYTRRVYDDVLGWYASADAKAQVILALDGAFLTFLAQGMFRRRDEIAAVAPDVPNATWILLVLMTITLLASIACALDCLRSRTYSRAQLQQLLERLMHERGQSRRGAPGYPPRASWFFQMIAELEPQEWRRTLAEVDATFEIDAMAPQIHVLAGNVRRKHRDVNAGFLLAAATFVCFFAAGLAYLVHVLF